MKEYDVKTTRRSVLTEVDQGASILAILEDDPLKRWGGRMIKEKLGAKGIHVRRSVLKFLSDVRV